MRSLPTWGANTGKRKTNTNTVEKKEIFNRESADRAKPGTAEFEKHLKNNASNLSGSAINNHFSTKADNASKKAEVSKSPEDHKAAYNEHSANVDRIKKQGDNVGGYSLKYHEDQMAKHAAQMGQLNSDKRK